MDILGVIVIPGWLLVVTALCLLSLYVYTVRCQNVWTKLGVPGPRRFPFLGIMNQYMTKGVVKVDMELHKKYGRVVGAYHGNIPMLSITDPEMIKQITIKDFSTFTNRLLIVEVGETLRNGVSTAENNHWKFLRNTLSPTFSTGKLKNMLPLIETCTENLLRNILSATKNGNTVEMKRLFDGYTLEVIASTAFGLELNCQKNKNDPFVKNANDFLSATLSNPVILMACIFPWLSQVFRYFDMSFFPKQLQQFFYDVTKSAIEIRKNDNIQHKDFLQLMLSANKECTYVKDSQERGMTEQEIYANALTFMIAGYDNTCNVLTFVAYCLATNPDIQDKLIKEIDNEISDQNLGYDNIMNLEYLDMVLSEVLRLYTPLPRFNRVASKSITISGVQIPKGVEVSIPIYVLHRDPDFWPDPENFDPERFTKENKEKRNPYCYLPFGSGPRNCIGMRLALFEVKIAIVAILQKFKLATTTETQIPPKIVKGPFVKPENGIVLKFQQR